MFTTDAFTGPLFIVGSPRSGTKLLRELLNRNPGINLCNPESHFIPYLYRSFGTDPAFFSVDLDRFFAAFDRMPFQTFSRRMGKRVMRRADFEQLRDALTWAEAFEPILRFYGDPDAPQTAIWGDKTPSYVLDLPLLSEIFPTARFIHIIRDPRDVAVSAQNAWRHNLLRSATKWARNVSVGRRDAAALEGRYMEIFYEDLLRAPEAELRRACDFLDVGYAPEMTSLIRPSENIGKAAGKRFIDAANLGRYRERLSPRAQRRIEEIVFDAARDTPYELEYATRHVPLSPLRLGVVAAMDGSRSAVRYIRKKGLLDGISINLGNRLQKRRKLP
ncbi:sulfotransferase [Limimaricola sp. G21655-S1]|uniref:sulfotransferase family protein n=1 Tax=unclassified Limimaricola TaxID=2626459 RepID=UPI0022AF3102|nr:sulfotransferase [Limimaricola sp. G21655-S1]MCZ4260848.1 sulfotransferase [Limimaricola sp. G21655-S1]